MKDTICFTVEEYGEKFDTYEEAYAFLADKFEWRYGEDEDTAEAYGKNEWICSRIGHIEEEEEE